MFLGSIGKSSQLEQSVRKAAEARTHHRVRKVIERAVEGGVASTVHVKPGEVLYPPFLRPPAHPPPPHVPLVLVPLPLCAYALTLPSSIRCSTGRATARAPSTSSRRAKSR